MNANDYQKAALRTDSLKQDEIDIFVERIFNPRLLQGLLGLSGESGECLDIYKKYLFQGHELDKEHLAKELGDVAWYLAVTADAIGYDLSTIFQMNIDKLKERYPDGFKPECSINRAEDDI